MSNGNNEFSWWSDALSGVKTPSVGLKPQQEEEEQDKNVEDEFSWWTEALSPKVEDPKLKEEDPVEVKPVKLKSVKTKDEGFNLFTEFTDSFNAITQGGKVGLTMAETTDEFSQLMRSGGESSKEEIQNAFEAIQKINNAAPIEAMEEWGQAYDRYIEKGDNAIQATYKATVEAGTDGFLGVMAQSLTSLTNPETLAAASVGAAGGAGAGVAGGILAPITVTGGILAGGFGAANAYSESVNRFSQNMQAAIRDAGKEVTPETIEEFLNDEDLFESVRMKSMVAGFTIGAVEGVATIVGGKAVSSIARATRGVTGVAGRIGVKAAKGGAAATIEGVGGSLGEAGAQAVEGRGFDTKEIIIEGIAGLGGAPKTAVVGGFSALNTKAGKYKVNGGKASRDRIIEILESDKITDAEKASIDIEVKNDNDLYSKVSELQSDVQIKSEIDERIINQEDRDKVFELEKQAKKLENKKTVSSKNELSEVKSEIKEITDNYKDVDRRIKAVRDNKSKTAAIKKGIRERRVRRDIEFVKQSGSQVRAFDTADEILADLDKLNKTLPKEQKIKLSKKERSDIKNAGGFYDAPNNVVYINKSVAADLQNTVGSHEVLHGILFRYAGNAAKQKILVEKFQSKLSQRQRNIVDTLMKKRNYDISVDSKGNRSSQYYTEYLTNFSDALNIKNEDGTSLIEFEENIFTKLGDILTPILRSLGFKKISFDSGQGVYNFMKEYNKSVEKGEFTEDLSSFLKQKQPLSQSQLNTVQNKISFSKEVVSKQEKIDGLVGEKNIDGNYKLTKQEWDAGKGDGVLNDLSANQDLQGLIKSKIPPIKFRKQGFSEEDFVSETIKKLTPHIRNFNPEKNNSLSEWINSKLDSDMSKIYKKGETVTKDKIEDKLAERVEVIDKLLEDVDNINFANAIKGANIDLELDDKEFQILKKRDGLDILNKVLDITKRVTEETSEEKNPNKLKELINGLLEKEYKKLEKTKKQSDAVTIKILKILEKYNQIRNERVGGVIQEISVFNLIKIDNAKGGEITLLKGTAMNDDSRPDIQIYYKGHVYQEKDQKTIDELNKNLPEGKEEIKVGDPITIGIEVKKDFGADFGSSTVSVNEKGDITLTNQESNFELLKASLKDILPKQLTKFFDLLDKAEGKPVKRAITAEKGKEFKQRVSQKAKDAWDNRDTKDIKIGGTFRGDDFNLYNVAKYYREKGNSYLEVANSGLFYLGNDPDKGNIFNAPLLVNQENLNTRVFTKLEFNSVLDKNKVKTGEYTYRLRASIKIDPKAGKPIPVAINKKKKRLTITNRQSIKDNGVSFSKNINEEFNKILEESQGVEATKRYSRRAATREGARKGRYKFFVPPSADNFMGLMYSFLGKGKVGEGHKDFFESNLMSPYKRGISAMDSQRQSITNEYKGIKKKNFKYIDQLKLEAKLTGEHVPNTNFNKDAAVRVYLWNKQGVKNSDLDLTQKEVNTLVEFVKSNKQLLAFADDLGAMTSFDGKYPEPQEFWESSTIVSDLSYSIDNARSEYLNEFIENSNEIFSEENLNKIQATYGPKFREALEGSLNSMKSGVLRRPLKKGSVEQKWYDWLNNSTATVMFFNVRSAILQTISSVNYLNWSDNNPVQAAKAFSNQKQFWKDFAFLFNSDKLRQRRAGTKINIAEAEISAAVQGKDGVNQTRSVIKTLLNKGFFFTQIADSFAIALGGASMYRNRVNSNIKKGMTVQEAEKAAFEDFDQITEETQQSSDPAEISQQQRSHFGRILLAFANTPMQYARLTKKAYLDLVNNRGDRKTNLSKLAYYAVVQNIIFTGMQTALFATLGLGGDDEDDEKKQKLLKRQIDFAKNGIVDSFLRGGLGYKGAVIAGLKNAILELYKQKQSDSIFAKDIARIENDLLSISPPVGTFFGKLYSGYKTSEIEKDVIEAKGFKFDSPIYEIGSKGVSAFTNIPADRALLTIRNITAATKENYETWERVLLTLGWSTWDLGLENHEHELIKTTAKDARRKAGYKKASETRRKNREAEMKNRRRESRSGRRSGGSRRESSKSNRRR